MTNVCMCTLPSIDPTACARCSNRWMGYEWRDEPPVPKKTITIDYDEYLRLMRLDGISKY